MPNFRAHSTVASLLLLAAPAHADDIPILKSYSIPSRAMLPTLHPGDVLMADAVAYKTATPKRGDVVIFRGPGDKAYIKRVIAVAGDTISSEAGVLSLNGKSATLAELPMTLPDPPRNGRLWAEGLPGGGTATILNQRDDAPGDTFAPVTVPEGHLFVMGDNRDNSNDSRSRIGMVSQDKLMGKAQTVIFSYDLTRIGLTIE